MKFTLFVLSVVLLQVFADKASTFHKRQPGFSDLPFNGQTNAWMTKLDEDTLVTSLSIPGTHDSGSINIYNPLAKPGSPHILTQSWSIYDQLRAGIRFFDIRLRGSGRVVHDSVKMDLEFRGVLRDINRFVEENRGEGVIMKIKRVSSWFRQAGDFPRMITSEFSRYPGLLLDQRATPTLGQLRGKVWLLADKFEYPSTRLWSDASHIKQNSYRYTTIENKIQDVTDHYQCMDSEDGNLYVNELSASGIAGRKMTVTIKGIARQMNRYAFDMYEPTGIVTFDYPSSEAVKHISDQNSASPLNGASYKISGPNPSNHFSPTLCVLGDSSSTVMAPTCDTIWEVTKLPEGKYKFYTGEGVQQHLFLSFRNGKLLAEAGNDRDRNQIWNLTKSNRNYIMSNEGADYSQIVRFRPSFKAAIL